MLFMLPSALQCNHSNNISIRFITSIQASLSSSSLSIYQNLLGTGTTSSLFPGSAIPRVRVVVGLGVRVRVGVGVRVGKGKKVKEHIAVNGFPSHSYGT